MSSSKLQVPIYDGSMSYAKYVRKVEKFKIALTNEKYNTVLVYQEIGNNEKTINLDTLTRLCKEWCYKQDYVIKSFIDHSGDCFAYISSGIKGMQYKDGFCSDTELEAVLKATQWVRDNK